MQDVTELLFRVITQDDRGLDRISAAVKKISADSGLTGQALTNLEKTVSKAFAEMSAAGLNFDQIIKRLSQSGDSIGRGVAGSAREIQQRLDDAAAAAKNLAKEQQTLQQAAGGLKGAISNPLAAAESAATRTAAALGPVGLAITGVTAAATLGGKALFDFVDAQGKAALQTVNMANALGITAGQMKQIQVAADISGAGVTSMLMASRRLSEALEDATGSGKRTAEALKQLGVSMQDSSGNARSMGDVFLETLNALSGVEDQTKRTKLAFDTLVRASGGGGGAAGGILALVDNFKELKKAAQELGYTDTTELQSALSDAEKEINKMRSAWELFKADLAQQISPIVIPIIAKLTGLLKPGVDHDHTMSAQTAADQEYENSHTSAQVLDLAAGARITAANLAARKNTDEGRAERLSEISKSLKEIADKFQKGGLGEQAASELVKQQRQLESERRSLQDAQARAHQAESMLREIRENGKYPDLSSPNEVVRLRAERQRALDIVGYGHEKEVDAVYGPKIYEAITKLSDAVQKSAFKDIQTYGEKIDRDRERASQLSSEQFLKNLHDQTELLQYQAEQTKRQLSILNSSDRDAARRQQRFNMRSLSGRDQNTPDNVNDVLAENIQSANWVRSDALQKIKDLEDEINSHAQKSIDDEKQLAELTTQRLQVEAEYRKEIDDAHLQAMQKMDELAQQQLDHYKQMAESIYSALRSGPGGMRHWLTGFADQQFGTIFGNIGGPILQKVGQQIGGMIPGQKDANGNLTAIGQALSGTIFSKADTQTPEIRSRDINTEAINRNTAALTKLVTAGGAATGSPADGLAQLISTTATPGSPAAGLASLDTSLSNPGVEASANAALKQISAVTGGGSSSDSGSGGSSFLKGVLSSLTGIGTNSKNGGSSLGNIFGSAAIAGAGIYEGINQLSKSGTEGRLGSTLGAVGAFSGSAAALDPDPLSKSILSAISVGAELFKSILPDPKTIRQAQIQNQTQYNEYVPPPQMNRQLSASGGFETYTNKYGQVQVSPYSSVKETQPYKYQSPINNAQATENGLLQNWETMPGQIIEPYQAPPPTPSYALKYAPAGSTVNLTINALDSSSILDRSADIATAVQKEVRNGHPVGMQLQQSLLGG